MQLRKYLRGLAVFAGVSAVVLSSAPASAGGFSRPSLRCDADNGGITLPRGFCAIVVADGIPRARHLAVTPWGDVYVAVQDSFDGTQRGGIVALRDTNRDGRADRVERFGDRGGNGIAYQHGHLFFAPHNGVVRYRLTPWQLTPQNPVTVVDGLPMDGDHVNKTIALDRSGRLYVNIGSASNSCQVENRALRSPGVDPCPELAVRAGIWQFNAWDRNQTQADGDRYAVGVRNAVALAVRPSNGQLYAAQNGRDQLHENWPDLFTAQDDLTKPSEELFRIRAGADYGWPYCYHDPELNQKVLAPEYGGDGTEIGRCANVEEPDAVYPAHWAPLGMTFGQGHQFPARYRNGAFIAFHGSRFDPASQPEGPGYNVVFQPFRGNSPSGGYRVFADGFAGDGMPLPQAALHRPVGLAWGPDGSLYVSDDKGGRIWRIIYKG